MFESVFRRQLVKIVTELQTKRMLENIRKSTVVKSVGGWLSSVPLLALILPSGIALAATPDLVVESIIWSPKNPPVGDTVTFLVTIANTGTGRADLLGSAIMSIMSPC
jgi:hypothetical protein